MSTYLKALRASRLVEEDALEQAMKKLPVNGHAPTDEEIAQYLVQSELVTPWQSEKLLEGHSGNFHLGKYLLLDHIGTGGMGSVYLAQHTLMKRRVALKVLPKKYTDEKQSYLARFYREAKAIASLNHPNIVQAFHIDNEKDTHYIVLEYVDGQSLDRMILESGPLPFEKAADYIRQAADGLEHAHSRGMIHRDIKPGNLLIAPGEVVKILDMGLAKLAETNEMAITKKFNDGIIGTADYMAPEQAIDSHNVDPRCDQYALGGTLYFLLAGHPPFPTGTVAQRIMAHQRKEPQDIHEIRSDVPADLEAIRRKMMAKKPEDRYESASDVSEAIRTLLREFASGKTRIPKAAAESEEQEQPQAAPAEATPAPPKKKKKRAGTGTVAPRQYLQSLVKSKLLSHKRLSTTVNELRASSGLNIHSLKFIRLLSETLIEQGRLTEWQHEQLMRGKKDFFLQNYLLLKPLGSGGMGKVFLAKHIKMRRKVAVKILPPEYVGESSYLERFQREAQSIAALEHPNIVQALEYDNIKDTHYMVLEHLDGQDLGQLVMNNGPLSCEDSLSYIQQAAEGLAYAHEAGVVHRDIKPTNLFLRRDGVIKILDLGLALNSEESHSLTANYGENALGTTDYMAPEQAVDSHSVDERADIYSLGCTLYFLLTGQPPFLGGSIPEKLLKHQHEEPEPLEEFRDDLSASVIELCRTMMAKDPADRYQSFAELLDEIEECELDAELDAPVFDDEEEEESITFSFDTPREESISHFVRERRGQSGWVWVFVGAVGIVLAVGFLLYVSV